MSDDDEMQAVTDRIDEELQRDFTIALAHDMRGMSVADWPNLVEAARAPFRTPKSPAWATWQRILAVDALFGYVGRMRDLQGQR